jgi:hypothetical protein
MRTTTSSLASLVLAAITFGAPATSAALDDAETLRCDATVARAENRLFGCLAECREKAAKRGAAFTADDQARCDARCARPYAAAVHGPRCAGVAVERSLPVDVGALAAADLRCRAAASRLAARLSSCLADCAELVAFAAARGIPYDPTTCVDACAAVDAASVTAAELRTGCDLAGASAE